MQHSELYERYIDLQRWIRWCEEDCQRICRAGKLIEPEFNSLIDDFYEEIQNHPDAAKVITGGQTQIDRLKQTLKHWIRELFSGVYDQAFVDRRWAIGRRHADIGLNQVYASAALARLRDRMVQVLTRSWQEDSQALYATIGSLNRLIDLDMAMIEDAYQAEYLWRQRQIERLATIGKVAGGIAHEMRNPLNVIKTSIYFLQHAKSASEEKKAEHLSRIDRQVGHCDQTISALSEFAKLPLPKRENTDLTDLLNASVQEHVDDQQVAVQWEIDEEARHVDADPRQLRLVFDNLIRNACQAMPDGGSLTLKTIGTGEGVSVSIVDTGVGIEPDKIPKIVEPFFSTKARGIGLGLALTKAILEKHDAALVVESNVNQGSSFTVKFGAAGDQ